MIAGTIAGLPRAGLLLALALPALSGCLTPHSAPAPSSAVAEARKGAGVKPAGTEIAGLAMRLTYQQVRIQSM